MFNQKNLTPQPKLVDWCLYGIVVLVCYFSFFYSDISYTLINGLNIWNTTPFNFYQYNIDMGKPAGYPYPIYIVFGIWNFPVWLIAKISGVPVQAGETYMYFLWAKLMIVSAVLYSGRLVYLLCKEMDILEDSAKWCSFIYLSSISVIMPAFVISQYDILTTVFFLLGIRALNKNNIKMFLLWFAISISMKMFSFLIFLPLVLLIEKKLDKIIKYLLLGLSIFLVSTILSSVFDSGFSKSQGLTSMLFEAIFSGGIVGFADFGILPILYSFICLFSLIKIPSDDDKKLWIIWIPMLSFTVFYTFLDLFHYYWMIVIAPLACITMFQNKSKINFLLWCNTLAEFGLALHAMVTLFWVFEITWINNLGLFPKIFGISNQVYTQAAYIIPKGMEYIFPNLWMVFTLLFIITTCPKNKITIPTFEGELSRPLVLFRLFLSALLIGIYLFCYFYTGPFIGPQFPQ